MSYGTTIVWASKVDPDNKTYHIALEIRDYRNNYLNYVPVNKDFIVNMIAKMETLEQDGYKYDPQLKNGYIQEGLE